MPCSTDRAPVSSGPSAYFLWIARATIPAAWRSVRLSANCSAVTKAGIPGDRLGAPCTPNADANGSSAKTSASSWRTRIATVPFGKAAAATNGVCSGTSASPAAFIDARTTPRDRLPTRRPQERSCRSQPTRSPNRA
jgi:hypothetical protein